MKALKILVLFCFTVLLVAFAALLQLDNAANSTLFSDAYFNRVYDKNVQAKTIDQLVDDVTAEAYVFMPLSDADREALQQGKASADLKKQADDFKGQLSKFMDKAWLEAQVPNLLKGSYSYFTAGGDKLPAVDIKPLKDAVMNVYSAQIASGGSTGSADSYKQLIDQIDNTSGGIMAKGKLNGKAVASFRQIMQQLAGISVSKGTAEDILKHAAARKTDGSDKQEQFQYAVKAVMNDELGMGSMKDTLDLNVLVKNLYGGADNPVSGLRDLIGGIKNSVFLLLAAVTLLLLAVVAVIAFSPKSMLRWIGAALMVSGGVCLAFPVLSLLMSASIHSQVAQTLAQGTVDLSFLQSWTFSYLNGVALFLLVQSLVVMAVGAAFLICSGFLRDGAVRPGKRSGGGHVAVRAVAAVVLVAAIPLSLYYFGRGITKQAEKYDSIMKQTQMQKAVGFGKALDETLGTKLFEGGK